MDYTDFFLHILIERYANEMKFDPETVKLLPPIYQKAFFEMVTAFNNEPWRPMSKKYEILQNFAKKFVLISKLGENITILYHQLFKYHHLPFDEDEPVPSLSSPYRKILTFFSKKYKNDKFLTWKISSIQWNRCYATDEWYNSKVKPETLVNFPHRNLEDAIKASKMLSVEPYDEEKVKCIFERNLFLYNQFMRDDILLDEWLLYLNEIEDDEVKIGLFEFRLGWKFGRTDKNLWKYYMDFMKEKDQIAYLNIYRRYTRFFVEDKEMVEEYRNEIKRISKNSIPISEFWIDTILYEFDFGTNETALKVLKRILWFLNYQNSINDQEFLSSPETYFVIIKNSDPQFHKNVEPLKATENPENSCYFPKNEIKRLKKTQNFSIPRTFIFYLTQNLKSNHRILQKLFNCCKYFFAIQPTPICYRLVLGIKESSKYRRNSLFLNEKDLLNFAGLENLYITDIFDIFSQTATVYSNIYKRLFKCDAKFGYFYNQILTISELKFMPNWRELTFFRSKIIHEGITYENFEKEKLNQLFLKSL